MKKLFMSLALYSLACFPQSFKMISGNPDYKTGLLGLPTNIPVRNASSLQTEDGEIPNTYDLSKKVSPIRDQGQCGSCWAFSTTATERDAHTLKGKEPGDLSEQYLVDCDRSSHGCQGGYFKALDMLVKPKGSPSLKDYPYVARNQSCRSSQSHPVASLSSWEYVPKTQGINGSSTLDVQKALLAHGPLSVVMYADSTFKRYASGVYDHCVSMTSNHMVNIVGYDNDGTTPNSRGMYPNGKGYWIARNSWGVKFGEKGFFKIKYTDNFGRLCNNFAQVAAFVTID